MRRLAALVLATALTAGAGAASAAAKPRQAVLHASSGLVSATLTLTVRTTFETHVTAARLAVTRTGAVLRDAPVGDLRDATYLARGTPTLRVLDLDGDGEPEVLISLFTGGAHCCVGSVLVQLSPDGRSYSSSTRDWGDPGYRLRAEPGGVVFVSADPRFDAAFTAFAATGFPVQVLRLRDGRLEDVTRAHRRDVQLDLVGWRAAFRREARRPGGETRGVFAAYIADVLLLGRRADADAIISGAVRRGLLRNGEGYGYRPVASYVRDLRALLRRGGYL